MKKNNFWEIKQAQRDELDIYLYSDIQEGGANIFGERTESDTSADTFQRKLEDAGPVNKINLYVNSKGGDVWEGVAIYNHLVRHPAKKTAYIMGLAASVASVPPMACETVLMGKNAQMMIHPPWKIAIGNAYELRQQADILEKLTESSKAAYAAKAGEKLSKEKLDEIMDMTKDTFLSADEAIALGLADGYIEPDQEPVHNLDFSQRYRTLMEPEKMEAVETQDKSSIDIERLASVVDAFFMPKNKEE